MKEIDVRKVAIKTPTVALQQASRKQALPQKIKTESWISKAIAIIKTDIHNLISPAKIKDEDWENYKRFCELAKRGK